MTLYLYRLTRIGGVGYDECAGFVVAAPDEARARSALAALAALAALCGLSLSLAVRR